MITNLIILTLGFASVSQADVRVAQGSNLKFRIPSNYNYKALIDQEKNDNDQFIRSNIDNEANKRNVATEALIDMLPCRQDQKGPVMTFTRGEEYTIPIRWNNPHDSSCEFNAWVNNKKNVIPIKRPFPCGGGYQDQSFKMTFPKDFPGCETDAGNCFLQIYGHSVETRTYAICIDFKLNPAVPAVPTIPPSDLAPGVFDIPFSEKQPAIYYADSIDTANLDSTFSVYRGQQEKHVRREVMAAIELRSYLGDGGLNKNPVPAARNELKEKVENKIKEAEKIAIELNKQQGKCFQGDRYGNTDPACNRLYDNTFVTRVGYRNILKEFLPQFQAAGLKPYSATLKNGP